MSVREDFIFKEQEIHYSSAEVTAPSNIAIVKYWGKHGLQLPNNPSISLTLSEAYTRTKVECIPGEESGFEVFFEGRRMEAFEPKIRQFFARIDSFLPFIKDHFFRITTSNTFPHSSGIASSASGMSALSLALLKMSGCKEDEAFRKKHSFLSRLGSGSAARSAYPHWVSWGKNEPSPYMSDLYASPVEEIHEVFKDYRDAILIVNADQKEVSSTAGHGLMETNPFAARRYQQAQTHTGDLLNVLRSGDLEQFVQLCESEALQLHALMMCSDPYFILLQPSTLKIIQQLRAFRRETGIPVAFTCDAGPNVHVLYPGESHEVVKNFILSDLRHDYKEDGVIWDKIGEGPEVISTNLL